MKSAHDFLAWMLPWFEGLSADVKTAALTIDVSLDADADEKDGQPSCVALCAQNRLCQIASCWTLQNRLACRPGRSKSAISFTLFSMSLTDRFLCAELLEFLKGRAWYRGSVRKRWIAP